MSKYRGTGVAIITPFKEDKSVDYNALEKLVEHLIANGINYLVVQGTTGESVTLTVEEKKEVLAFIIRVNNNRLPIVLGIGGNSTAAVVNMFKRLGRKLRRIILLRFGLVAFRFHVGETRKSHYLYGFRTWWTCP